MTTPLHDCVGEFASDMLSTINQSPYLALVKGTNRSFYLPTGLYVPDSETLHVTKKPAAATKTPDFAYRPIGSRFPTIVIEAGWSESPWDLHSDARQWILKASGKVQVVVTVFC